MRKIKKPVSILLVMVMIVSLFTIIPFDVSAASGISYIERSWDDTSQTVVSQSKICSDYTTLSSQSSLTLEDGKWYVVNGDATINERVTVSGKAYLILLSGTLTCNYGIRLSRGNSLYVYPGEDSEGTLNAKTGSDEEANIGGNEGENCGEFEFHGGTLKAHNNDWCSGGTAIGGGGEGGNCGALSFYGGTVDTSNNGQAPARKSYGAAIGDGNNANSNDGFCHINIYGGTITADNDTWSNGSGIGGGEDSTGCPIHILGGKIVASAYNGAAIGSGQDGGSSTITIKNACVEAESYYGAGVGSGEDSDSESIVITNSYVKATTKATSDTVGAEGAGIGGGNCGKSNSIKISKSVIIASSGRYGAGIGGGDESDGGVIEISDSNVFAHSAQGGAGIGGGDEKGCDSITLKNSLVVAVTNSQINTAGEKFLKDYGSYYNTIMESISNPAVTEQAGFYAAGALTAMVLTYLIQGTHTGAGIGSGDSGFVNNILIDNCVIMAHAGECAAGIGGGDEGGFGTINIKKSKVFAEGGDYGAGIGSGDEAETCGTINLFDSEITARGGTDAAGIGTGNENDTTPTINISDSTVTAHGGRYGAGIGGGDGVGGGSITITSSTVTADSKTDAAGIGGGEGGNSGIINITDCSTVTATGGGYAAGIGSGDDADGDTITIRDSVVKAYGGTDATGIGGGEGGNGGTINIYDSNVYAEGNSCGAGIGNGEDGDVTNIRIYGDSRVEAFGGNSDASAIGHGDNGVFYDYHVNTYLDSELKVKAGSSKDSTSIYFDKTRYDAVWNNRYALVYYCEHEHTEWRGKNSDSHALYCNDCRNWLTSWEAHQWNDDGVCTVCGGKKITLTLTIIEKDQNGQEIRNVQSIDGYSSYTLPECENIPDGYGFLSWKVYDPASIEYFYPPGERLTASWASPVVEAVYLPLKETTYIDKNGAEKTVMAKQVSALENMEYLLLITDGWYVIDADLDIKALSRCYGDVKFIVEDGCTWSAEKYESFLRHKDFITGYGRGHSTFSLYGQKNQTGYIDGGYTSGVSISTFNQYGARFHCYTAIFEESCKIYRGSFDSYDITQVNNGEFLVDGGDNRFMGLRIGGAQIPQIGWTKPTDSIMFALIGSDTPIKIKDGQAFKDNYGNIYKGEITLEQLATLSADITADKTLTPYIEHHYDNPVWSWMNDYKDATALFKCTDDGCDDEQLVKAKVTYEDKDNIRNSTATCELNGNSYTTTHSGKILWDITITENAHGTVTAEKEKSKAYKRVDVTVTPKSGYALQSWSVIPDDETQNVETFDSSFIMPESDVAVNAEFVPIIPASNPYIDENGAYHPGNIEYVEVDGEPFSVNEDGTIGEKLDDVSLSYFDFKLRGDDTYQITYYTGPKIEDQLMIPKTYNGKAITVLGNDDSKPLYETNKSQFELVLNENITEIRPYTFYVLYVTKVTGDTSRLSTLGSYAFSWANSPGGYTLDIKLDFPGQIKTQQSTFNHMKVTARMSHKTGFSSVGTGWVQNIDYIFTDAHTYGDPVWNWAEDHASAAATFTCTDSRCRHEETVDATIKRGVKDGKNVLIATAELGGKTYTDTKEFNYFAGHSLSLDGDIGVNFYLDLIQEELAEGVRVDFVLNGKHEFVTFDSASVKDEKVGYYRATCNVCAAEMNDEIAASITIGDASEPIATESYKVRDYADVIMENKDNKFSGELITLVKTMLNYGASAQSQFEHNTEHPANAGVDYALIALTESEIDGITSSIPSKAEMSAALEDTGIEYYGYSLILKTKTTLRFYFKKNDADATALALINSDHENVGKVYDYNDDYCYIEVENIPAYELSDCFELQYGEISLGSFSTLSYVKDVVRHDNGEQPITNTVTALYRYNEAAIDYFNSIAQGGDRS